MSTITTRRFLTIPEVARLLRLSRDAVYRKIQAGDIPALRLNDGAGPLRVDADELEAWLYGEKETR
jgi:excisionase family DNA binding protein